MPRPKRKKARVDDDDAPAPPRPTLTPWTSETAQFLRQNKCAFKGKSERATCTHLSYDGVLGGMFWVPPTKEDELAVVMSNDIQSGTHIYLVECRTSVFAAYFDIDGLSPDATADFCRQVHMCILRSVMTAYDHAKCNFEMMILDTNECWNKGQPTPRWFLSKLVSAFAQRIIFCFAFSCGPE